MKKQYIYGNHLKSKPFHYEYSNVIGIKLLKQYEYSRTKYINKIKNNRINLSTKLNKKFNFNLNKNSKTWPYLNTRTELVLENIIIDIKYKNLPIWAYELVRKFEVSKRIRNFYDRKFKRVLNTHNASIHAYVCLYYIIANSNCYNNELKKYNVLLKLGDIIFGSYDLVKSDFQKKLIFSAVHKELKLFKKFIKLKDIKYE